MEAHVKPDGRTRIIFTPDTAAGIRAAMAALKELGDAIDVARARPSNERPWHKHTLPNRKKRR